MGLFKGAILLALGLVLAIDGLVRHFLVTTLIGVISLVAAAGFFYFAVNEGKEGAGTPPRADRRE
jgi:uncharacterized membrane protein HdeD (DUF308 family)